MTKHYRGLESGLVGLTFDLHAVLVAFLPGAGVLEPDLDDPLGEAGDLRDPLQVVAIWVRIQLEVGLEDLQLLVGECGPHALRLVPRASFAVLAF